MDLISPNNGLVIKMDKKSKEKKCNAMLSIKGLRLWTNRPGAMTYNFNKINRLQDSLLGFMTNL